MKEILASFFVGAIAGFATFLMIRHLVMGPNKTLFSEAPESEEGNSENSGDSNLKVG